MPCPHVEAWYVEPHLRKQGIGTALIKVIKNWAKDMGFKELTSDALLENELSFKAHVALGLEPTERIRYFKKKL